MQGRLALLAAVTLVMCAELQTAGALPGSQQVPTPAPAPESDGRRGGKPSGNPDIKAGEGNLWQRVTHESCVMLLTEGNGCEQLESRHHKEFIEQQENMKEAMKVDKDFKMSKAAHDKLVAEGKDPMKEAFSLKFETPEELCAIVQKMVAGKGSSFSKGNIQKRRSQAEKYCDDNFPDMVKHASELHWHHVQRLRKQDL